MNLEEYFDMLHKMAAKHEPTRASQELPKSGSKKPTIISTETDRR
jgi:hypothetical protein